jgi:PKD repeat protein
MTPYSYSWQFGDGTTGQGSTPAHTYSSAGNYTTCVTVEDSANDSINVTMLIQVPPLPPDPDLTGLFSVSTTEGVAPLSVAFVAEQQAGNLAPYAYLWEFGDGSYGTGVSTSHVFSSTGDFTVILEVSDAVGHSVTSSRTEIVVAPLDVNVEASVTSAPPLEPVSFSPELTGGLAPYTFEWGFGDGTPDSRLANPSHSYLKPGNYTITVMVTDALGERALSQLTIEVVYSSPSEPPPPIVGSPYPLSEILAGVVAAGFAALVVTRIALGEYRKPPPP